jgi:predicted permease
VLLAIAALRAFTFAGASLLPRWETVSIDASVALYALVLAAFVAVATGTLPAIMFARRAAQTLRTASRSGEPRFRAALRAVLVSAEIALACALSVSAGLTLRSFLTLTHTNVGFNAANLYDAAVGFLPSERYSSAESEALFVRRLQRRIAEIPGIAYASVTNGAPFADENSTSVHIPGRPDVPEEVDLYTVDSNFFHTMQLPLLRGRAIAPTDDVQGLPVIVVSAALAKRYFGTVDVVGRRIVPGMCGQQGCGARTIIGVSGDTRDSFALPPVPTAYVPIAQMSRVSHLLVRMQPGVAFPAASVARAFASVDPMLVPPTITPFSEILRQDAIAPETATLFFGCFALIALILALAGVYAVTSFSVAARTQEFGVRKAIGATDASLLHAVARQALVQAALGAAAGLVLTAACSKLLAALLYDTSPFDVRTFSAVLALIVACCLCAAVVPAIRATRIPPSQALRYE